jgi:hypothetical protein
MTAFLGAVVFCKSSYNYELVPTLRMEVGGSVGVMGLFYDLI